MFRLPDFRSDATLTELRNKMKAELIEWKGDFAVNARRLSFKDLQSLETVGLEIDIDAIDIEADGTLTFGGEHVLLYIMQPRRFHDEITWPKYHVSNCNTWASMKEKGRQDRYVASRRVDGFFEIDIPDTNGKVKREEKPLRVCKVCLANIAWKGYAHDNKRKSQLFNAFSLTEFFDVHRKSLIKEKPKYSLMTMPSANYTDDFDERSRAVRTAANWTCSKCGLRLTKGYERRFLHTHHLNGTKGDNTPSNLSVLCLGCHAEQPDHQHMKKSQEFKIFEQAYGSRSKSY